MPGRVGIIPAYAGSTGLCRPGRGRRTDHPRIRGEHGPGGRRPESPAGSSPHTRGARPGPGRGRGRGRIIPAYAGSTRQTPRPGSGVRDHPRIRGEHLDHRHPPGAGAGSSPHTRGARPLGKGPPAGNGIIPAYAGSTGVVFGWGGVVEDHPRIRGEHQWAYLSRARRVGSSPHTRGARGRWQGSGAHPGIIPAYAGSTEASRVGAGRPGDHPRIRGEHERRIGAFIGAVGSSPHTRGAHSRSDPLGGTRGIIPAYAGSTSPTGNRPPPPRDHPRIRGEHDGEGPVDGVQGGSSPHTRGARWRGPGRRSPGRIIPAYAGSTYRSRVS